MNNRQKLIQQQFLYNEEAVIKRLNQVYNKALGDINGKIKNLTFSIGKLQQEYDWLDDTDPKKVEIKSQIQSKIYQKQYQEQLQKQVDGILKQMQVSEFTTIAEYLDTCYTDGFIGTIFDAHGQGVPFTMPLNQEAMVRAVQLDSKISKGLYTRLGEDVSLLKKKITAEVSRGIATNMSFKQVAKQLAGQSRIGYNNAIRIARTEGHRIQQTATMDVMHAAKDRGAEVVKQWDATLDGKTRDSHSQIDMQIRELDKPFSNGLMYPGDPSGSAAEVINCRCTVDQRARWELDDSFTKFNNFTKQLESFDSPKDYETFKKAFFSKENKSYMNYVQQLEDQYGTKDFAKVLGGMTEQEYKHYSRLLKDNPIYNTKAKETPKKQATDPYTFTDDQKEALEWYVSGDGQFINQYHRGKIDSSFGELSDQEKALSDLLDEATDRVVPDDIKTLYRSVDAEAVFGNIDDMQFQSLTDHLVYGDTQKYTLAQIDGIVDKTKGKTVIEKGFMSTTKDYELASEWGGFTGSSKPIVLEFDNIPKNLKGADLKMFDIEGDEQYEVLLARNTKYEIVDIYGKDGHIHVKAKFLT